jgi:hypothetical protein
MAAEYNFDYNQGTTLTFLVTYQDDQENPIDLTDYQFRGQIRLRMRDTTPAGEFVITGEDLENGLVRVTLQPQSLIGVQLTNPETFRSRTSMVYDIEMESPLGDITRLLNGTVRVSPEVTR